MKSEFYRSFTILIVDDERDIREIISYIFERKGFTVLCAESGSRAIQIITNNKVDLVISDMRMPDGDGMYLLNELRSYHSSVPSLIFVTGFSDKSEAECIARGAKNVLSKPFDQEVLVKTAFAALGIWDEAFA